MKPFVVELGMGIDLHGQDVTKAAQRAVRDAIERNSLPGLRRVAGLASADEMIVEVVVAVPWPDEVDADAVLAVLPFGRKTLRVVQGGMLAPSGVVIPELGDRSDEIVVANACVVVSVPDQE